MALFATLLLLLLNKLLLLFLLLFFQSGVLLLLQLDLGLFLLLLLLIVFLFLRLDRLLDVSVAQSDQQLVVTLLLPLKGLILQLCYLFLVCAKARVCLALLVALAGLLDWQRENFLKAAVVRRLKNVLLLPVLVHGDPTLLVLLLEGQLGQHAILLLLVQPLYLGFLLLDGETQQAKRVLK